MELVGILVRKQVDFCYSSICRTLGRWNFTLRHLRPFCNFWSILRHESCNVNVIVCQIWSESSLETFRNGPRSVFPHRSWSIWRWCAAIRPVHHVVLYPYIDGNRSRQLALTATVMVAANEAEKSGRYSCAPQIFWNFLAIHRRLAVDNHWRVTWCGFCRLRSENVLLSQPFASGKSPKSGGGILGTFPSIYRITYLFIPVLLAVSWNPFLSIFSHHPLRWLISSTLLRLRWFLVP